MIVYLVISNRWGDTEKVFDSQEKAIAWIAENGKSDYFFYESEVL